MLFNDIPVGNMQLHSPSIEQRLLFPDQIQKAKQQNGQERLKEKLKQAIKKLRSYTKIKNITQLNKQQLYALNDVASNSIQTSYEEKNVSKFEQQYYQYKQQSLNLQALVSNLLQQVKHRNFQSIKASHPLLIFWSFLKFLLVLHLCFIFPLSDSFVNSLDDFIVIQMPIFFIEIVVLSMDIIMRLNVQIYNKGILITQTKQIVSQYFRKEFLIDFSGVLGLLSFLLSPVFPFKYLFVLKVKELSIFMEVFKYEIDPKGKFKNHLKLLTLLITVVLLAHCFACIWIGVGQHSSSNNWIFRRELENSDWLEIYLNALYFAITTMTTVGYGDITPVNPFEVSVCICLILFSSCIFAYVFNTITSILKDLDADRSKLKHDMEILSHYMKKRNIDSDLQKKVENYLSLVYKHQPSTQEKKIFNKLSPQLQQELSEQDKGVLLLKQPMLVNNFSFKFIKELIECVQEINLTPGEVLAKDQGLYIILKGGINVLFGEKQINVGNLRPGDCAGLKSMFVEQQSKRLTFQSPGFSTVYFISQTNFLKKLKDTDLDQFFQIRDRIMVRNYDNLFMKCILCRKQGHELCEDINFSLNKDLALAKHCYTVPQNRLPTFIRKKVKKSKTFEQIDFKRRSAYMCYQKTMRTLKIQSLSEEGENSSDEASDSYDELEQSRHQFDENKDEITVFFDKQPTPKANKQFELKSLRTKVKGTSIVRMLQNYSSQKVWHDDLFIIGDFDKMKCFRMYHPTSNYDQVIKYYNQWRRKLNKTIQKHIEMS